MIPLVDNVLQLGHKLIDKLIPDPEARSQARLELMQLYHNGELKMLEASMSAILAEAQSEDRWTSRARPAFLYVMYSMILSSIPMGVLFAFAPTTADAIIHGVGLWLSSIPSELWTLFSVGYLGYAGARTFDKIKGRKLL